MSTTANDGPRKGAGRPPKSEAGTADATIYIRCPRAVKVRAEHVAALRETTLSRLIVGYLEGL